MNVRPRTRSLVAVWAATLLISSVTLYRVPTARAQAKTQVDAEPRFDVASVKLDPSNRGARPSDRTWGEQSGRVTQLSIPLKYLILDAYDLRLEPKRLVGPDWMAAAHYDIRANAPAGTPKARILLMMRSLLKERFQMKIHKETKFESAYALVVRKGGPKLKTAAPGRLQNEPSKAGKANAPPASWGVIDGPYGRVKSTVKDNVSHTDFESVTMPALAKYLGGLGMFDTTFVDRTGLAGSYQVWLDTTTRELIGEGPVPGVLKDTIDIPAPAGRSVMESLHQQGLDVVKQKLPIEKWIIDHIERIPTAD
jgi:uncharacterized protein (TIGR03435 family)